MKFIRNGRIRDRIIDTVAKGILIAFSALVCLWMISGARAAGVDIRDIKQHTTDDGDFAVEFLLSKAVEKQDVSVDFQRNFIQLSLRGVSAYPARTEHLNNSLMDKVFTYQYQPDMARARLLLKGQASGVKKRSSWEIDGSTVRILVRGTGDSVVTQKDSVKTKSAAPTSEAAAASVADSAELKAREDILQDAQGGPKAAAGPVDPVGPKGKSDSESLPIFAAPPSATVTAREKESPAAKIFASLLLVVGVIGAGALAFRRFVQGKGVGFPRQAKMIHVISTQSLGPKRSIALVKVLDQHMVVGMSGDGMNLLANLGAEVNLDKYEDDIGLGASFTDTLHGAITGGSGKAATLASGAGAVSQKGPVLDSGFRASLKKRLEGFKPL